MNVDFVTRTELDAALADVRDDMTEMESRLERRLDRQDAVLLAILAGIFLVLGGVIGSLVLIAHG